MNNRIIHSPRSSYMPYRVHARVDGIHSGHAARLGHGRRANPLPRMGSDARVVHRGLSRSPRSSCSRLPRTRRPPTPRTPHAPRAPARVAAQPKTPDARPSKPLAGARIAVSASTIARATVRRPRRGARAVAATAVAAAPRTLAAPRHRHDAAVGADRSSSRRRSRSRPSPRSGTRRAGSGVRHRVVRLRDRHDEHRDPDRSSRTCGGGRSPTPPNISVNLSLDPNLTYYVSVQAQNGAGLTSPIVTSNPVRPVWTPLGQAGQRHAAPARDHRARHERQPDRPAGRPTQVATMTSFFNRMYPILRGDLRAAGGQLHRDRGAGPAVLEQQHLHPVARRDPHGRRLLPAALHPRARARVPQRPPPVERRELELQLDALAVRGVVRPGRQLRGDERLRRRLPQRHDRAPAPRCAARATTGTTTSRTSPELRGTDFWSEGGGDRALLAEVRDGRGRDPQDRARVTGLLPPLQRRSTTARINANPTIVRPTRALIVDIIADRRCRRSRAGRPRTGSTARTSSTRRTSTGRRSSTASRTTRTPSSSRSRTCTSWRRWRAAASGRASTARSGMYHRLNGAPGSGRLLERGGQHGLVGQPADPADPEPVRRLLRHRLRPQEPDHRDRRCSPWPGGSDERLRDEPADARPLQVRDARSSIPRRR